MPDFGADFSLVLFEDDFSGAAGHRPPLGGNKIREADYTVLHGPDIAAGQPEAERGDSGYHDVILENRLRQALTRLNADLPPEALEDAYRKLIRADAPSLIERNRTIHRMLVDGVTVEYRRKEGSIAGAQARVIDFEDAGNNDWLAINQFTVAEGQNVRRPDIVLFLNGLPLAVIELKNAASENANVWSAFAQLQTYQMQIPTLFATNAVLIASDGVQARMGALRAGKEWFKPWRTITGHHDVSKLSELQVMLEGVFEKRRFLDVIRHFIVFEDEGAGKLTKKIAGYHQFHAVNVALRGFRGEACMSEEPTDQRPTMSIDADVLVFRSHQRIPKSA